LERQAPFSPKPRLHPWDSEHSEDIRAAAASKQRQLGYIGMYPDCWKVSLKPNYNSEKRRKELERKKKKEEKELKKKLRKEAIARGEVPEGEETEPEGDEDDEAKTEE
jgi:hypothetical protein